MASWVQKIFYKMWKNGIGLQIKIDWRFMAGSHTPDFVLINTLKYFYKFLIWLNINMFLGIYVFCK